MTNLFRLSFDIGSGCGYALEVRTRISTATGATAHCRRYEYIIRFYGSILLSTVSGDLLLVCVVWHQRRIRSFTDSSFPEELILIVLQGQAKLEHGRCDEVHIPGPSLTHASFTFVQFFSLAKLGLASSWNDRLDGTPLPDK